MKLKSLLFILLLSISICSASIQGPTTLCTTSGTASATYSIAHDVGNVYSWSVSPGASITSASNASLVNVNLPSGTSTVLVSVTNGSSTVSHSLTVNVGIVPVLTVTAVPSMSVCSGKTIALTASGASTLVWSGGISNGGSFTVSPLWSGFTVTGTSTNGCMATQTVALTVYTVPSITGFATPSGSVCPGTSVTLVQNNTGAATYSWSGGVTDGIPFPVNAPSIYTVTGVSADGCIATATVATFMYPLSTLGYSVAPSSTICHGATLSLSGTGSTNYIWSDGVLNNVSFQPTSSHVYTVMTMDANSCTDSKTVAIVVNSLPIITPSAVPGSSVCFGSTVALSGAGAQTYTWTNGIVNNVPFTVTIAGTQTVTGTGTNGCIGSSVISLVVYNLPVVGYSVTPSATVCAGSTIALSGSGASTYSWSGGVSDNVPFTVSANGNYTVIGITANGCSDTTVVGIVVNQLPTVVAQAMPSPSICAGSSVTLYGSGALTYSWTGGVLDSLGFIPAATSSYVVNATDLNGCEGSDTISVVVNPLPNVGYNAHPSLRFCFGTALTLSGTGAVTYTWTNGVADGIPFVPTSQANYTLTGTDANGCTNSLVVTATLEVQPNILTSPVDQTISVAFSTQFSVVSSSGSSTYQWQVQTPGGFVNLTDNAQYSGTNSSTLNVQNAVISQNGSVFRCVINDGNCYDTSTTAMLTVLDDVGVRELSEENMFSISPNPANDRCTIYLKMSLARGNYLVVDQAGKLVLTATLNGTSTEINLEPLAQGLYTIRIEGQSFKPLKLVKE